MRSSRPDRAASAPLSTHGLVVGHRPRRSRPRPLLTDLDLALAPDALTCLLGPNGSGKTTLVRTLLQLQPPLAGHVCLGGEPTHRLDPLDRARRLAAVLTDPIDAGLLRVDDLVTLGRHPHTRWDGRLSAADRAAVDWAIAATGAERLRRRPVVELSDGERQRVLIARALAQQPEVLILDEAVAFVDAPHRVALIRLLADLARECRLSVLVTTHDVDLALRMADVVWLIEPVAEADPREPAPSRLHVDAPEDLAVDGRVGAAFDGAGVAFDVERGGFAAVGEAGPVVRVEGDEPAATWACRAAERAGAQAVRAGPAAARVTVTAPGGGAVRWHLDAGDNCDTSTGLGALADALRRMIPQLAAPPSTAIRPAARARAFPPPRAAHGQQCAGGS